MHSFFPSYLLSNSLIIIEDEENQKTSHIWKGGTTESEFFSTNNFTPTVFVEIIFFFTLMSLVNLVFEYIAAEVISFLSMD